VQAFKAPPWWSPYEVVTICSPISGYYACPKLMELCKTKKCNGWLVLIYSSRHRFFLEELGMDETWSWIILGGIPRERLLGVCVCRIIIIPCVSPLLVLSEPFLVVCSRTVNK
jgi:hypothetical protein